MEVTEDTSTTEVREVSPDTPPAPVPPSERPLTGVEREALLLTPVEVDYGKAA